MTFPALISANFPGADLKLQLLCRAASLPESIIREIQVPYFGRTVKIAGNREYDDWDFVVMNDEDFVIRNAFEAWHNAINTTISNRLDPAVAEISGDPGDSYKTQCYVTQMSKSGPGSIDGPGAIKAYKLNGCFPTIVSNIQLDAEAVNRIEEFQVRLAYDWFEPYESNDSNPIYPLELSDDIGLTIPPV